MTEISTDWQAERVWRGAQHMQELNAKLFEIGLRNVSLAIKCSDRLFRARNAQDFFEAVGDNFRDQCDIFTLELDELSEVAQPSRGEGNQVETTAFGD